MTYIITPYVLISAFAAIMALVVAVMAWQRHPTPGRTPLIGLMLSVSLWSGGAALEYAAIGIPAKQVWLRPEYIGVLCSPVFFFLLALEYAQQDHWLSTRSHWLLFATPALVWLLAITNERHGLIWPAVTLAGPPGANLAVYEHGIAFWLGVVAYSYVLMLIGTVLLLRAALRFAPPYRRQAGLLITATLAPWAANLVYVTGFSPLPGLELTPLVMVFTGTIFAWSIFRFHLLDLAPVARERLIETMADGMLVLDERERVIDFNPAVQRLLGLDSPVQYGQPAHTLFASWPQWPAHATGAVQVQIAGGAGAPRYVELSTTPLFGHRGQPAGRLLVLHDITASKAAQREIELLNEELEERVVARTRDLMTSQEQFRQVVASISDHVFALRVGAGSRPTIIYSSPRIVELTGGDPAELAADFVNAVTRLTHPPDREALATFVQRLMDSDAAEVEYRILRPDGEIAWLRTSARVQAQAGGRTVFGVTSDITGRKQMERITVENQAMAAMDRLRTELIGNVSHELRTPLGLIKMGATTLLRRDIVFPPATQQRILHEITRETDHLERLVLNLLDMSRLDQNRFVLHAEPTDLNHLITTVAGNLQRAATENKRARRRFVLHLPDPPLTATVDAMKIEQVVRNLLENAIHYSPRGGAITVRLHADPATWELWVTDEGIGIAPEDLEHIFERFFRSRDVQVQKVRGAGLGLSICNEIVRAHGGEIRVTSSLETGSTFIVSVPRCPERPSESTPDEEELPIEYATSQDSGS